MRNTGKPRYVRPKHSHTMAIAEKRLLNEAITALRRVDHVDEPYVYVEEAHRSKSYLPSG